MANIKSAQKRIKQNEKRRIKNAKVKSSIRTAAKKVQKAAEAGPPAENEAKELLKSFTKKIDTAAGKNVIHWKTAARKKSRLAKKINALSRTKSAEA